VVVEAAKIFPRLKIICSANPDKSDQWFTPEEAVELWQSYNLPPEVTVVTLAEEMVAEKVSGTKREIVMVRGIRNCEDLDYEKKVALYNKEHFGITHQHYVILTDQEPISSTRVRELAENLELEELSQFVSPVVITALLKKVLQLHDVIMVVGPPASGKSKMLQYMHEIDRRFVHVNTDDFNVVLRPLLAKTFGEENISKLAVDRQKEQEVSEFIKRPWFDLLRQALRAVPKDSVAMVEIPWGLRPEKRMFRFLGNKVLVVGCPSKERNEELNALRGTSHLRPFIHLIPGLEESRKIAEENNLSGYEVINNGDLEFLRELAEFTAKKILS
jgi:pantetheine-phosphate adenylyltransferase